jgi:hypothetical protein
MRVNVGGPVMTVILGERYIDAVMAEQAGSGIVFPMYVSNRSLGGSGFAYDPATGAGQKGITNALGLNNIGLLIRTVGKVTAVGSSYIYIDDGSGLSDGTNTGGVANRGIRIIYNPSGYAVGDYLEVTGVSSCFAAPVPNVYRQVLATEVKKLAP